MSKKTLLSGLLAMLAFFTLQASHSLENLKPGDSYHGFRLIENRFVQEVNAWCLHFEHTKSGAQLMKIAADDPNKTFNIMFKTVPQNSTGVAHIMEHAVLNGSESFPVKSPFDELVKGSLNTFINAMTGSDRTMYPIASMNHQDYFNLMHVYLDAVFKPRIYTDPFIFLQEGWHHEMTDPEGEVNYRGVVFNEMKGAYSNPLRELDYQLTKALFPDNTYGFCSGGYPSAIPDLSYEEFLDFHRTFYHPSNSHILLYGDADLMQELDFINRLYLSQFERSEKIIKIPVQRPFEAIKEIQKPYAVAEDSPTRDNTYLELSWVCGPGTDNALVLALEIMADALVNHESAALKQAIQQAGIGRQVMAGVIPAQQNRFVIRVLNANPEDKDTFREIVFQTLEQVSREGFDAEMIEGIVNRREFAMREGNTSQKGLSYSYDINRNWFFEGDPYAGLEFEKTLARVKQGLQEQWLESLIKSQLVDNPHAVLISLIPEPGLEGRRAAEERARLNAFRASLTEKQRHELVERTKALREYQQETDSPEALASIPMLSLSDIDPQTEWIPVREKTLEGIKVLHVDEFTNDILYASLMFDMKVLPQDMIPWARLLQSVIGSMSTENYHFGELNNAVNIHTGGINSFITTNLEHQRDDGMQPWFMFTAKATRQKSQEMFSLLAEIIGRSDYSDTERLKTLLSRHHSQLENQANSDGFRVAMSRLNSYVNQKGMFEEQILGLSYYRFVSSLMADIDQQIDHIAGRLQQVAERLFTREAMLAGITCDESGYASFASGFTHLAGELPSARLHRHEWVFDVSPANEGLRSAAQVQYVVQGYDFKKMGYRWDGRMRVLSQILSRDYLQNRVRVIGGAYGGFTGFSPSGMVFFASYRDPNLKETLDNYAGTPEFLRDFEADDQTMTRFIIGTIAGMDRPLTPSQKGNLAIQRYLEKTTHEELLRERQAVLSTTAADIRAMEPMVSAILGQKVWCVYGSEDKLRENQTLFHSLIPLTE